MKKSISELFDILDPAGTEELIKDTELASNRRSARRIARAASEKAGISSGASARRGVCAPLRKALLISAAALLIIGAGAGSIAYAEAKQYSAAVEFFEANDVNTEGMTRQDIKEVYRDISSDSFKSPKTAKLISRNLEEEGVLVSVNTGNARESWKIILSFNELSDVRLKSIDVSSCGSVIEPGDGESMAGLTFFMPQTTVDLETSSGRVVPRNTLSLRTGSESEVTLICNSDKPVSASLMPPVNGEPEELAIVRAVFIRDNCCCGYALYIFWGIEPGEQPRYLNAVKVREIVFDGEKYDKKKERSFTIERPTAELFIDQALKALLNEADPDRDPRSDADAEEILLDYFKDKHKAVSESFENWKEYNPELYGKVYVPYINGEYREDERSFERSDGSIEVTVDDIDYRFNGMICVSVPGHEVVLTCDNQYLDNRLLIKTVSFRFGPPSEDGEDNSVWSVTVTGKPQEWLITTGVGYGEDNAAVRMLIIKDGEVRGYALICFWFRQASGRYSCCSIVKAVMLEDEKTISREEAEDRLDRAYVSYVEGARLFYTEHSYYSHSTDDPHPGRMLIMYY